MESSTSGYTAELFVGEGLESWVFYRLTESRNCFTVSPSGMTRFWLLCVAFACVGWFVCLFWLMAGHPSVIS